MEAACSTPWLPYLALNSFPSVSRGGGAAHPWLPDPILLAAPTCTFRQTGSRSFSHCAFFLCRCDPFSRISLERCCRETMAQSLLRV